MGGEEMKTVEQVISDWTENWGDDVATMKAMASYILGYFSGREDEFENGEMTTEPREKVAVA